MFQNFDRSIRSEEVRCSCCRLFYNIPPILSFDLIAKRDRWVFILFLLGTLAISHLRMKGQPNQVGNVCEY